MSLHIISYCIYLVLSVVFTVWVAGTLFKNGRVFLYHIFRNDYALADSVNHLLVVGFYLVNLGFISLALRTNLPISSVEVLFEVLASKMGVVLLTLGFMHFGNMVVFAKIHRAATEQGRYLTNGTRVGEAADEQLPPISFIDRFAHGED